MNDILDLEGEFLNQTNRLLNYVKTLNCDEKAYYRNNQEIIYTGLINRAYSLWETYNKDLMYTFYLLTKENLIAEGNLIQRLKLFELPGYIFEDGIYDNITDSINFKLKKDFITYTGKNMDVSQMKSLYGRFDIKIDQLLSNKTIKSYLVGKEDLFEININGNKSYMEQAVARLILERNLVSHFSTIDDYQNLDTIEIWLGFYQVAAKEVGKMICCYYTNIIHKNKVSIGDFVNYLDNKSVLLIDIHSDKIITKESLIGVQRNNSVEQILKPTSFMVNNSELEQVKNNDKAGIKLKSIFDDEWNIKQNDLLFLI